MRPTAFVVAFAFCATAASAAPPQKLYLWPDGAPGARANGGDEVVTIKGQGDHVVSNVHRPSITVYLPEKHTGVSVIVVPGGGHRELWTDHEGHNEARFLNERGIAAFVYPGTWADLQINASTPPMWLLCGSDDRPEVIAGITNIYLRLREAKVPAELHLYDGVPHGFGMRANLTGPVSHWPQIFVDWIKVP